MKKHKFFLYPFTNEGIRSPPPWLAFDTENEPESGGFISASMYGKYIDSHGRIHKVDGEYYESRYEFMDKLKKISASNPKHNAFRLVGHNTDYDLTYINEIVNDESRLSVGSRFITARMKLGSKKGIKIYDTMNYVDGTLKEWIESLQMEQKYGIIKIEDEKEGVSGLTPSQLRERNIMDAKATYYLMSYIDDFMLNELNIKLQLTVGSCSLNFFRKKHLKQGLIRNSQWLNNYERESYRGGRVEVFKTGLQHVKSYDVHKMYLTIMRDELLPLPQSARYVDSDAGFNQMMSSDTLFIAQVKLFVPIQRIAPLPYFLDKLIFPTGTFTGYYTSVELKEALKYGVKILAVYDYVYYKQSIRLFRSFAEKVMTLITKYASEGNKHLSVMIKKIGNTLYGKLGEQIGGAIWIKEADYTGSLEGMPSSYYQGEKYVYVGSNKEKKDTSHTFPCIPAFITSYGRVKMLRALKQYESDVVYCDTDSKHLDTKVDIPDEKEFGGWGFEYERIQKYRRPKMYAGKNKGVPKKAELILTTDDFKYFVFERPYKRTEAIRKGDIQNRWVTVLKRVSLYDDKRVWDTNNDSMPIHLEEEKEK